MRGHLQADINPLGYEWIYHPELDPATYGLTIWDLDREFVTGGLGDSELLQLRETYRREVARLKGGSAGRRLMRRKVLPVPHDVAQAASEQMREGDADSARLHLAAIRRQLDAEEPQYRH